MDLHNFNIKIKKTKLGVAMLVVVAINAAVLFGGVLDRNRQPEPQQTAQIAEVELTGYQKCNHRENELFVNKETGGTGLSTWHWLACNEVFVEGNKDIVKQFYASNGTERVALYEKYRNQAFTDFAPTPL